MRIPESWMGLQETQIAVEVLNKKDGPIRMVYSRIESEFSSLVLAYGDSLFEPSLLLKEGLNLIKVEARDFKGASFEKLSKSSARKTRIRTWRA